jgi:hypothetical protein
MKYRDIDNRPWSVGGTRIMTGVKRYWPLYCKALSSRGALGLTLLAVDHSLTPNSMFPQDHFSIHCLNPVGIDLSPFWDVVMGLEKKHDDA